jgi:hypothetical protein
MNTLTLSSLRRVSDEPVRHPVQDRRKPRRLRASQEGGAAVTRFDEEPEDIHGECRAEIDQLRAGIVQRREELTAWEEREASACPEDIGFEEYIRHLISERDAVLARSIKLEEMIIWMSGSSDFGPGGQAHEGWLKAQYLLSTTHNDGAKP